MSEAIYQQAIKDLARQAHGSGRLIVPDRHARLDTPLCGDRIDLELRLTGGGLIAELAHETRGCLLCRASASLLGLHAPGHGLADIAAIHSALTAMLKTGGQAPAAWDELKVFLPVRPYRSRHDCVLLPFQALQVAFQSN